MGAWECVCCGASPRNSPHGSNSVRMSGGDDKSSWTVSFGGQIAGKLFADPSKLASNACRRRYMDFVFAHNDVADSNSTISKLLTADEAAGLKKERFWLFVKCMANGGDKDLKTPYLFAPQQ